ncbi:MAG: hypothetical protein WDO56_32025 [Gammaproteobacteria bacterium]
MAKENIKHWKIGDVEVARIVEVNAFEDNMWMLLDGATEEFVQQYQWLVPHFATPSGKDDHLVPVLRAALQGRMVMIDTCIGADRKREFDVFCNMQTTFLEDLEAAGFPGASVTDVICTRTCISITSAGTRSSWTASGCRLSRRRATTSARRSSITGFTCATRTGITGLEHLEDAIDPVIEAGLVEYIGPDFRLNDEVSLFPTPGHTPGHVSVLIESRGQQR